MSRRPLHRGFTLIEVIVAVAVIALGIGALLSTLTNSAGALSQMRERSFAQWIALNKISETRLATSAPGTGVTSGEVEYAGSTWQWRQEVTEPPEATGVLRIDVAVGHNKEKAAKAQSGENFPAVAKATGFFGTNVGTANGLDPSWVQTAPAADGGGGGGGGAVIPGAP